MSTMSIFGRRFSCDKHNEDAEDVEDAHRSHENHETRYFRGKRDVSPTTVVAGEDLILRHQYSRDDVS